MKFTNNKKNVKEYMHFEDGKVVSIEVEEAPKPKPIDPYPVEEPPAVPLTDKAKLRIKQSFTPKRIKIIVAVIVLLLFALSLKDIYSAFTHTTDEPTTPIPSDSAAVIQVTSSPTAKPPTAQPNQTADPGKTGITNCSFDTNPIQNGATVATDVPVQTGNQVGELIQLANQATVNMLQTASDEITYITQYQNKQANKIGLKNRITKSYQTKQSTYVQFTGLKELFYSAQLNRLYDATEQRLLESIVFTKQIEATLDGGTQSTQAIMNTYVTSDDLLRSEQQTALLDGFTLNGLQYRIDESNHQITYQSK